MKLKSGTIAGNKLPEVLENELNNLLDDYKTILKDDKEFAHDLLLKISQCFSSGGRFIIFPLIKKFLASKGEIEDTSSLHDINSVAGSLLTILVGSDSFYSDNEIEPIYSEAIYDRMQQVAEAINHNINLLGVESNNEK